MGESAESVVRRVLASLEHANLETIMAFWADDGEYADPRGVWHGSEAIRPLMEADLAMTPSVKSDIRTLVSDGRTVMMERVDTFPLGDKPFSMEVAAAIEIDANGLVRRWREYFDMKSVIDSIEAAGINVPTE